MVTSKTFQPLAQLEIPLYRDAWGFMDRDLESWVDPRKFRYDLVYEGKPYHIATKNKWQHAWKSGYRNRVGNLRESHFRILMHEIIVRSKGFNKTNKNLCVVRF